MRHDGVDVRHVIFRGLELTRPPSIGANTLLSYFHYCNRNMYPFSDACKDEELRRLAGLDPEAIAFVNWTKEYAARSRKSFGIDAPWGWEVCFAC